MKGTSPTPSVSPGFRPESFQAEAQKRLEAATHLLPEGSVLQELRRLVEQLDAHIADRMDDRSGVPVLAALGPKNSGKTTLIRSLLKNREVAELLPTGDLPTEGTEVLTWIGPHLSPDKFPAPERIHPLDQADMIPLGHPYLLLDVPGYGDVLTGASESVEKAIRLASVHLLMIDLRQWETVAFQRLGNLLEGSIVIPLFRSPDLSDKGDPGVAEEVERARNSLLTALPLARIHEGAVIPSWNGSTQEEIEASLNGILTPLLSQALRGLPSRESRLQKLIEAEWSGFEKSWERILQPLANHLGPALTNWQTRKAELTRQIVNGLLGDEAVCRATIEMEWRLRQARHTWGIFIPYKAVLVFLSFLAGKWNTLLLGSMGSIPAWIMGLGGAWKNWRRHQQFNENLRSRLRGRVNRETRGALTEPSRALRRSWMRVAASEFKGGATSLTSEESFRFHWEGLDDLETALREEWNRLIAGSITWRARFLFFLFGAVGTAVFIFFLGSPLAALYAEFLKAWGTLETGRFPNGGFRTLGTALLLALPPALIWGMLQLWILPGSRRVRRLEKTLRSRFQTMVAERTATGSLELTIQDPLIEELGRLQLPLKVEPEPTTGASGPR